MMLHIAQKAFFPSKLPFPLLHVDTTWKFREMIAFRDVTAAKLGDVELWSISTRKGWRVAYRLSHQDRPSIRKS